MYEGNLDELIGKEVFVAKEVVADGYYAATVTGVHSYDCFIVRPHDPEIGEVMYPTVFNVDLTAEEARDRCVRFAEIGRRGAIRRLKESVEQRQALLDERPVIVTRHDGAVAWLAARGITGPVIEQATEADVAGKVVIGNLPLYLAAAAAKVGSIDMPSLPRGQRGEDLSPSEMDAAGATIRWYIVVPEPLPREDRGGNG